MYKIMKYLTPIMYYKLIILNNLQCTYRRHVKGKLDFIDKTPRPAILFIKKHFKNKLISGLELGVQIGNNSISILKELNIHTLYLVDSWNNYVEKEISNKTYRQNYLLVLKKFQYNNKVKIIKGFSETIAKDFDDNILDFIYIDANHNYNFVYQDLDLWSKKVKINGIISGHDVFNHNDVLLAVKDWCIKNKYKFYINPPDWYFIK